MASSTAVGNYAGMNEDDLGVHRDVMETNGAILRSLLEEFQEEDRDEERLNSVIQSLEAEIFNPSTMDSQDSSTLLDSESNITDVEDSNLWNTIGGLDIGQDCSVSSSADFDQLGWFDLDQVACSPSDDMNWYMDSGEYEMDFPSDHSEWVGDYSHVYYGAGLEEHVYSSLWQETAYDSIMYD